VLVVIDEFPYLVKATPSLPSLIQRALDPRGVARHGVRLVLCGSAMSVMSRLLAGGAPLRGRASLDLVVRPLEYRLAAEFWGVTDLRLAGLGNPGGGGPPAYPPGVLGGDAPRGIGDVSGRVTRTLPTPRWPPLPQA